jgi:hypothetical protein
MEIMRDFFPLPDGYSEEPQPLTDDQVAGLRALFSLAATPPARESPCPESGTRSQGDAA